MEILCLFAVSAVGCAFFFCIGSIARAIGNNADKRFEQYKSTLQDRENEVEKREAEVAEREKRHANIVLNNETLKLENRALINCAYGHVRSKAYQNDLQTIIRLRSDLADAIKAFNAGKIDDHTVNGALFLLHNRAEEANAAAEKLDRARKQFEASLHSHAQAFPWLSQQIADLHTRHDWKSLYSIMLRDAANPDTVKGLQQSLLEKQRYIQLFKQAQYQLSIYETVFPFLQEFSELSSSDISTMSLPAAEDIPDYDHARDWLSKEEYAAMDPNAREMMALQRYINRKKTNWELGIEYEQYVGYQCEQRGYRVQYNGATRGLEDMGRDLVLTDVDGMKVIIIQCKRWAAEKTIHEKHIFQLYGSVVTLSIKENLPCVIGAFVTTAKLSKLAADCAKALGIHVIEEFPMDEFPRIKCNIGKDGERIYHMPYDQQYNNVVITPSKGEFYSFTNKFAQARGFRRAWRWSGN